MSVKNVLVSIIVLLIFSCTAYAEQPMADEYRSLFGSGVFCVEYSVRPYTSRATQGKPGIDDPKEIWQSLINIPEEKMTMAQRAAFGLFTSGYETLGTGMTYIVANNGNQREKWWSKKIPAKKSGIPFLPLPVQVKVSDERIFKEPILMFREGKYYRFSSMSSQNILLNESKSSENLSAIVLQESDLHSPELDLTEGWGTIRMEMELPDEFAPFCSSDLFRDKDNPMPSVTLMDSYKCEVGKCEYDCDVYDTGRGITYYMLYKDGSLALIQKFNISSGEERLEEEVYIRNISGQLPDDAFIFAHEIPVYAAGMGDVNDFLGVPVQVETLGGVPNAY